MTTIIDPEVTDPDPDDNRPIYRVAVTYPVTDMILVRSSDPLDALAKAHRLIPSDREEKAHFTVLDEYEYTPIT